MKNVLILIIISLMFVSCDSKKKTDPEDIFTTEPTPTPVPTINPPTNLMYLNATMIGTRDSVIPTNIAVYTGGTPKFRSIPEMPAGLLLNEDTGFITGSPLNIQLLKNYVVIAYNDGGTSTFSLKIEVNDIPPVSIIYSDLNLKIGETLSQTNPVLDGNFTYINLTSGELPTGMLFSNGTVWGTPVESGDFAIVISGGNSGGEVSTTLNFSISGLEIQDLTYESSLLNLKAGKYYEFYPTYGGDVATSFISDPGLPEGLVVGQDGYIRGTSADLVQRNYVITGSNEWGSDSFNLAIGASHYISGIALGENFSCVIKNRKALCWGENSSGQLGFNSTETCYRQNDELFNCSKTPQYVKTVNNEQLDLLSIASASNTVCGVTLSNNVLCWGDNTLGQLGTGLSIQNSQVPLLVKKNGSSLGNVKKVIAGLNHFCSIGDSGDIHCWGSNLFRQVSPSVTLFENSANEIFKADSSSFIGAELFNNSQTSCAIDLNSELFCWGRNIGSLSDYMVPTKVLDATNMIAGYNYSYILNNTSKYVWGDNSFNQLFIGGPIVTVPTMVTHTASSYYPLTTFLCLYNEGLFCSWDNYIDEVEYNLSTIVPTEVSKSIFNHWCYSVEANLYCLGSNDSREINQSDDSFIFDPELIILP